MGLNENSQEPGETNVHKVHNYQHVTRPAQIHILPENQYDNSSLTSKGHSKSSTSVTWYKVNPSNNLVILTSYPLIKHRINIIDRTETHGYKPHYKG